MVEAQVFRREYEIRIDATVSVENSATVEALGPSNIPSGTLAFVPGVSFNLLETGTASGLVQDQPGADFSLSIDAELTDGVFTRSLSSFTLLSEGRNSSFSGSDIQTQSDETSTYVEGDLDISVAGANISHQQAGWNGSNTDELLARFEIALLARIP